MQQEIKYDEDFISPRDEECIKWAIRFFLGRNPMNNEEIQFHRGHDDFNSVRTAFCQTQEFKSFYRWAIIDSNEKFMQKPLSVLIDPRDKDCIKWAIRFFIGRNPLSQNEINFHSRYDDFESMRIAFCRISEFRVFYKLVNGKNKNKAIDLLEYSCLKDVDCSTLHVGSNQSLSVHNNSYNLLRPDTGEITLTNIVKQYNTRHGISTVLNGINLSIRPGEKVGILGCNGAGKSTLIRLISGAEHPTSGSIIRGMNISWPLAFGGAFQGSLTGLDNLRFICRVYGVSIEDKIPYVQDFSELGKYLREPVKTYSSGMRARLAFAISMVIEFDCYLIDEVIAVGDTRFHEKCQYELFEKRRERAMIMVSHQANNIREHCTRVCVLTNGTLKNFSDIDAGYEYYQSN